MATAPKKPQFEQDAEDTHNSFFSKVVRNMDKESPKKTSAAPGIPDEPPKPPAQGYPPTPSGATQADTKSPNPFTRIADDRLQKAEQDAGITSKKAGGVIKGYAKGGKIDGIAQRGKTRGKLI